MVVTLTVLVEGFYLDIQKQNENTVQNNQDEEVIVVIPPEPIKEEIVSEEESTEPYAPDYNSKETASMYVDTGYANLNVREEPDVNSEILGKLEHGSRVTVLGEADDNFLKIRFNYKEGFVSSEYLTENPIISTITKYNSKKSKSTEYPAHTTEYIQGMSPVLNSYHGTVAGPSGKETYYNLNMNRVVQNMKNMGIDGEYWVREDGCKMLGPYILVAANLNLHPRGSLVQTSLGIGISADTGDFAKSNPTQIDIATTW